MYDLDWISFDGIEWPLDEVIGYTTIEGVPTQADGRGEFEVPPDIVNVKITVPENPWSFIQFGTVVFYCLTPLFNKYPPGTAVGLAMYLELDGNINDNGVKYAPAIPELPTIFGSSNVNGEFAGFIFLKSNA